MREISVAEQRYQAVLAVISDGLSISQVAGKVAFGCSGGVPRSEFMGGGNGFYLCENRTVIVGCHC